MLSCTAHAWSPLCPTAHDQCTGELTATERQQSKDVSAHNTLVRCQSGLHDRYHEPGSKPDKGLEGGREGGRWGEGYWRLTRSEQP